MFGKDDISHPGCAELSSSNRFQNERSSVHSNQVHDNSRRQHKFSDSRSTIARPGHPSRTENCFQKSIQLVVGAQKAGELILRKPYAWQRSDSEGDALLLRSPVPSRGDSVQSGTSKVVPCEPTGRLCVMRSLHFQVRRGGDAPQTLS